MMKAVLWEGPDRLKIASLPRPSTAAGASLVRIEYTGLCGTDFSILHGSHPRATAPLVMGHEIVGRVVETGDERLRGRRVAVLPLLSCGVCAPCRAGHTHVCERLGLYGIDEPGGLAEFAVFPDDRLFPLNDVVPARVAALVEPLAVAVHAVSRSGLTGAETVVVFGAGPIGILTALVARHRGAGPVVVVEPSAERRTVAEELGFRTLSAGETAADNIRALFGGGADIVFDTAAHPSVALHLPRAAAIRGTIVLVGVYKQPTPFDLQAVTFAEQSMVGVRVYTTADFREAVEIIQSDALGLERLPVSTFGLDGASAAFAAATSAGAALKVLVGMGSADEEGGR
ncbi:alcohol dehydrogenase catalytic domain-containing protein [Microbacterium sp. NPDC077486]|uniref:zinc-dependent alcohol dehydrogenase n=1 Tax=Microbacterium sp. NPDC077486 TaxID=3154766 RepID=UPI003433C137